MIGCIFGSAYTWVVKGVSESDWLISGWADLQYLTLAVRKPQQNVFYLRKLIPGILTTTKLPYNSLD